VGNHSVQATNMPVDNAKVLFEQGNIRLCQGDVPLVFAWCPFYSHSARLPANLNWYVCVCMQLINRRQELLKVQEMPSLSRSHSYLQQVLLTHLASRYISICLQLLMLDFKHPTHASVVALARFSPLPIVTIIHTQHRMKRRVYHCAMYWQCCLACCRVEAATLEHPLFGSCICCWLCMSMIRTWTHSRSCRTCQPTCLCRATTLARRFV